MKTLIASAAALALLTACSQPETAETPDAAATSEATVTPEAAATPSPTASASAETLALEGLGDLVIGKQIPDGSSFAERGAQAGGLDCRTVSSPDYPGVYAITEDGVVRRISVGSNSSVKLVEGIGPGSTEAQVMQAFPGFVSTPHKYVDAPAKYLTQPGDDPRLRFEIDADGKVSVMHVGMMPQLGYVEGCA